jgi:2-oxoglutarate ferredoxin oxidoreductase subunit beta
MLQACPTYNHFATHEYLLDRYFDANAGGHDPRGHDPRGHDPSNLAQARALATQVQDRIACGILYQREDIPDFYNRLIPRQGLETTCVEEVRRYDVSEYWKELV